MSLIHWWPLNGNLYDYGTNPKHGTLLGSANVTTAGILGKCLSGMNGTQTIAGVSVENCNLVNELSEKDYSFSCWFKVHGTHIHYNGTIMSSGNWNNKAWAVGVDQTNSKIDMFCNHYNKYIDIGYTLTNNKWYNLISIQKAGVNTVYLNGIKIGSSSQTAIYQSDATNLTIGRETYAAGHFSFNGDICDVRVYDHALSLMEVKEISKGLMLHYAFNDRSVEETTNLVTSLTSGGRTTADNTAGTITTNGTDADTYFYLNFSSPLVQGETYTISCMGSNIGDGNLFKFGMGSQSTSDPNFIIKDGYNEYTFVSTANSSKSSLLFDDMTRTGWKNKAVFSNFQVEKKDHASIYTKGTRSAGKLPDDSGYLHSGKIKNITLTSDSIDGSLCANFDGNLSYVEIPNFKPTLPNEPYTIAFWVYPTENKTRDIYFGNHANSTQSFNIERNASNQLRIYYNADSPIGPISAFTIPSGAWAHVAITYDGSSFKAYKNSELVYTYSTAALPSLTCSNANWKIGSDYRTSEGSNEATRYKGKMADFRIYATALSQSDISNLYKRRVGIDKLHNIHTHEIIEGSDRTKVNKNFTLVCSEISESGNSKFYKNGNISGNNIYEN